VLKGRRSQAEPARAAAARIRTGPESTAAIVSFGERIALSHGLNDGLRTDALVMALIVAAGWNSGNQDL
jgi:hypothetical protein